MYYEEIIEIIIAIPFIIVAVFVAVILWRNYGPPGRIEDKRSRVRISLRPTSFTDKRWREKKWSE